MNKDEFTERLIMLRKNKGISARDMSLSLGQSPNYINHIEKGKTYPSMSVFFSICDYFEITPKEFFDSKSTNPVKEYELLNAAKGLSNSQLDNLIAIIKDLKR